MQKPAAWITVGLCVLGVVFAWYKLSPYQALAEMRAALVDKDVPRLEKLVDFPKVRESMKSQATAYMMTEMQSLQGNPFAALGAMLATKFVETMVDGLLTPAGMLALLNSSPNSSTDNEKPSMFAIAMSDAVEVSHEGLDRFTAQLKQNDAAIPMTFARAGLSWQLVDVKIPNVWANAANRGRSSSAGSEPKGGHWQYSARTDRMDDSSMHFLIGQAEEEVATRYSSVLPKLYLRCRKGRFDAFVDMDTSLDYRYDTHTTTVRLRWDEGAPTSQTWGVSDDREAVFAPDARAFAKRLLKSNRLLLEVSSVGNQRLIARFEGRKGLASYTDLAKACPQAAGLVAPEASSQ